MLFPLLFVFLKPVIIEKGLFDGDPVWIQTLFWCSALIIFVLLLTILWCFRCCLRHRYTKQVDNGNGNLNSFTIHNEANTNIKDRVRMNELKSKRKSDPGIQSIFVRSNNSKSNLYPSRQTSQTSDKITSIPSSPKDFIFNDAMRSSDRLSSCYSCSKSLPDDDMVNIFLNKLWTGDSDTNEVKFEVVGKSINQAKRIQIEEIDDDRISTAKQHENLSNTSTIVDGECRNTPTNELEKLSNSPIISVPVRHNSRLKSEVFFMVNDDSTLQVVDSNDDVFK